MIHAFHPKALNMVDEKGRSSGLVTVDAFPFFEQWHKDQQTLTTLQLRG